MKQTLINKYLAGETTISEERELRQLLLDIPTSQQSKAERSILELLCYSGNEEMEEDIFAVDYTEEYDKHVRPSRTIRLWPWLAAACVAAMLIVFLAPPKAPYPPRSALATLGLSKKGELQIAHVTEDSTKQNKVVITKEHPQPLLAVIEHKAPKKNVTSVPATKVKEPLSGKAECEEEDGTEYLVAQEDPVQGQKDVDVTDNPAATQAANSTVKSRVLTERDIPVTRPENLKYTKEELALMRKQANEAYIKWVELELEIARYNQEQTAQK